MEDLDIHQLYSDNRWEKSDSMLGDLINGITLIVDRYAYSGVAYTGAKPVWCHFINSAFTSNVHC